MLHGPPTLPINATSKLARLAHLYVIEAITHEHIYYEVCGPLVITFSFIGHLYFEWCMATIVFEEGHEKDTCDDEVGA